MAFTVGQCAKKPNTWENPVFLVVATSGESFYARKMRWRVGCIDLKSARMRKFDTSGFTVVADSFEHLKVPSCEAAALR